MKVNQWRFEEALGFLREKRAVVEPNAGFAQQLRELELSN
jgi:hypothetical protein